MKKAVLVDYYYCTGCHTCEIACAVSHDLPTEQAGVVLSHIGPWESSRGPWQDDYLPFWTKNCDLCQGGQAAHDGAPMCVHHCQAQCIKMGEAQDLARELAERPNQALYLIEA